MQRDKAKALFLNFNSEDIGELKAKEILDIETCYANASLAGISYPSSPGEYKIIVANLDEDAAKRKLEESKPSPGNDGDTISTHITNKFVLAFLGKCSSGGLANCGLSWVRIQNADVRDKEFDKHSEKAEIFSSILDTADISLPIHRYIGSSADFQRPLYKLFTNKVGGIVGAASSQFIRTGDKEGNVSEYAIFYALILPNMNNKLQVIDRVIQAISRNRPELLGRSTATDWADKIADALPEIKKLSTELQSEEKTYKERVRKKEVEIAEQKTKFKFITQILVANDQDFEVNEKLSPNIQQVLQLLGFDVENVDEKAKGTKKEDFWVSNSDYFAICEVTGTKSKNPKRKEYNDLVSRMLTFSNRRNTLPEKVSSAEIKGMLIINQDMLSDPDSRPDLYTGDQEDIVLAAIDQGVSIISTVVLFKVVLAMLNEKITKTEAREILTKPGRVKF